MIEPRKYRAFKRSDLDDLAKRAGIPRDEALAMKAVAEVLPFRVNSYVLEELIDWKNIQDDPIYQLTFPQRGMLDASDLATMIDLVEKDASRPDIESAAKTIQHRLNPHPAGQVQLNVPTLDGERLSGIQHKYRETVLFFPSQGQTCHAYCTYCFRWAQFVGLDELKFASHEIDVLVEYLKRHREVSSVLITGGDPLIMTARVLARYLEPLLVPELEHITSIRLGTKATAWWPYRFVTDGDAGELLSLFERVVASGKHLALMSHYSHPRELETEVAQAAVRRIDSTGAVVRCQAPLARRVNDDSSVWADLWRLEVQLGAVPYYMFVERDTGPKNYFEVPLARAHQIFVDAYARVSGLARTVRGPSMSTTAGKVVVDGVAELGTEKVFVLRFLQARNPDWIGRPFLACFDPRATWFDQLRPRFGSERFFFEPPLRDVNHRTDRKDAIPRRKSVIFPRAIEQ